MLRYAIHPDFVLSRTDGDIHYIGADALIHLYQLRRSECFVVDDSKGREIYAKDMAEAERLNLIHLFPRYDGNYTLKD